jgi:hypothetical protein
MESLKMETENIFNLKKFDEEKKQIFIDSIMNKNIKVVKEILETFEYPENQLLIDSFDTACGFEHIEIIELMIHKLRLNLYFLNLQVSRLVHFYYDTDTDISTSVLDTLFRHGAQIIDEVVYIKYERCLDKLKNQMYNCC